MKFLVGLDGSDRAKDVLHCAAAVARKAGAKLILFRAVGVPVEVPSQAYNMSPNDLGTLLEKHAYDDLLKLAQPLGAELLAGVRVVLGSSWQAICDAAKAEHASLIVIGSHGYGALDRVLGTTAAKVVNHADRSVLVVRAGQLLEDVH